MTINVRNGRFVVRADDDDPSFARWAIEFDGRDYVVGTRSAPRDDVYEFIDWLRTHVQDLEIDPGRDDSDGQPAATDASTADDTGPPSSDRPGQSYG